MNITYRKAGLDDLKIITDTAIKLYTDHPYEDIYEENAALLRKSGESMWLAYDGVLPIAFAHASLRYDYVEGTNGGTIGYLEGIFVEPEYRKHGIARHLVEICEHWAREQGCAEFASDCELHNTDSIHFHLGIGFAEAGRLVCFVKKI